MKPHVPVGALSRHLSAYRPLFRDRRLFDGFSTLTHGILASGGLRLSQIARAAPRTTCTEHAERRLRRLVHGGNARADLSPARLAQTLTELGAQRLAGSDEVLVILDESDLRKPHSQKIEHLDTVRSLDDTLVHGFHTLTALGISSTGTRALLYQTSFRTRAPGFKSKNAEYRAAVNAVKDALTSQGVARIVWVLDRGFDALDFLRFLHAQGQLFVVRGAHLDRRVRLSFGTRSMSLDEALHEAPRLMTLSVEKMLFDPTTKRRATLTKVRVHGCTVYSTDRARTPSLPYTAIKLEAEALKQDGWVLLSNLVLPEHDVAARAALATRLVVAYRQRWAIEDVFAWTKNVLGWESVRLMRFDGVRVLVGCAWIVAAFLFELGGSLGDRQLQLIAHLGGWRRQAKHPPGKRVLTWGLERLAVYLMMQEQRADPQRRQEIDALLHDLFAP